MKLTDDECYKILGISPGASERDIKDAHRFLAQGFHSDKYSSESDKKRAEEKLKEINIARDQLLNSLKNPFGKQSYYSPPDPPRQPPIVKREDIPFNPPNKPRPSYNASTKLGIKSNLAAFLCYLPIPCCISQILSIILLVTERQNPFVSFHAIQSLLCFAVSQTLVTFLGFYLSNSFRDETGNYMIGVALSFILPVLVIGVLALQGKTIKIPILGLIAASFSSSDPSKISPLSTKSKVVFAILLIVLAVVPASLGVFFWSKSEAGIIFFLKMKYDDIQIYGNEFYDDLMVVQLNNKYGLIDRTGKEIIAPKYDDIPKYRISEGLVPVKLNNRYGVIDQTGKEVVPLKYDDISSFLKGIAVVKLDGKFGFIDNTGKEIIPLKYDHAEQFSNGRAKVKLNNREFYIDKNATEYSEY